MDTELGRKCGFQFHEAIKKLLNLITELIEFVHLFVSGEIYRR
jgi:hypothetical protein